MFKAHAFPRAEGALLRDAPSLTALIDTRLGPETAPLLVPGDSGDNILTGTGGSDTLLGRTGTDTLIGLDGDDLLSGGLDGDIYVIEAAATDHDTIIEMGSAPVINGYYSSNIDDIRLIGYATLDEALHSIDFDIDRNNLTLFHTDPSDPSIAGEVTVRRHFSGNRSGIEAISLDIDGVVSTFHVSSLSGDQYTYSVHNGPDAGGEDVVLGTDGADEIYGGLGTDILFGGLGMDTFMFHDEEDGNGAADILLDFAIGQDTLDFTDIAGFTYSGVTISDSAWGNALITTIFGTIELVGVLSGEVSEDIFAFA